MNNLNKTMKSCISLIVCVMAGVLVSCSPKVISNITHTYAPQASVEDVVVLKEKELVPAEAEWMGSTQVNGKGNYNQLLDLTRLEAWKNGAKYVRVKDYSTGTRSDVHVMNSDLFGIDKFDSPNAIDSRQSEALPEESTFSLTSDEDSRLYILAGGEAKLSNVNETTVSSFSISLGLGYSLSPKFSCELGAMFSNPTLQNNSEKRSTCKGLAAALVYHHPMKGNLSYIPQVELDYLNYKIDDYRLGFMSLSINLLAFEYRADDSMWGFRGCLGDFGVAFPVGKKNFDFENFQMGLGPIYGFSLNRVSLGIVRYF